MTITFPVPGRPVVMGHTAAPVKRRGRKIRRRLYTTNDALAFYRRAVRIIDDKGTLTHTQLSQVTKSLDISKGTGYQWMRALRGDKTHYISVPEYLDRAVRVFKAERRQETQKPELSPVSPTEVKSSESERALQALRAAITEEVREEVEQRLQKALTG